MREYLKEMLSKYGSSDYSEIRAEESISTEIIYTNGKLEKISTGTEKGGQIRAIIGGTQGVVTFNKFENLDKKFEKAYSLAKSADIKGGLAKTKPIKGEFKYEVKEDPRKIPLEEKENLVRNYSELFKGMKKLQKVQIRYKDRWVKRYFLTNEGTDIVQELIYTHIAFYFIARDGSVIQRRTYSVGKQAGFEIVKGHEEIALKRAKEAVELLSAEMVEPGVYTVILDQDISGVFIHEAFGHLAEADHVFKNEKLKEIMKKGKKIGNEILSVVDDGSIKGEWGFYFFDDEGVQPEKTYIIKNGILNSYLHSRETAYVLGDKSTGNARAINYEHPPIVRMSATYIEPREKTLEELLDIPKGIYAIGSVGGQTAIETFTFVSQKAYLIENGKIKKTLRGITLSGNVFETLLNIEAIGNDLKFNAGGCGKNGQSPLPVSVGGPHIRIKNVLISGGA